MRTQSWRRERRSVRHAWQGLRPGGATRRWCARRCALRCRRRTVADVHELDVEDKRRLRRDERWAALHAVGELVGDDEAATRSDPHPLEALVPADDDGPLTLLEGERR